MLTCWRGRSLAVGMAKLRCDERSLRLVHRLWVHVLLLLLHGEHDLLLLLLLRRQWRSSKAEWLL